jgi:hypothetical protein
MATAGLPDEGIYKFRVETIEEVDRETREGTPYTRIEARFVLLEDTEGDLSFNSSVFENFYTDGRGLERFTNLVKAVTGEIPQGEVGDDGVPYVDTEELLDAIRGGEAWGVYNHLKELKQDGTGKGRFGWNFNGDPAKLRFKRSA